MRSTFERAALSALLAFVLTACVTQPTDLSSLRPPVADRHPHLREGHGDRFVDDYFWLRDKTNPAVIDYLKAENAYTEAMMKGTERFQKALYGEMLGRIQETDLSVPTRKGDWLYYTRSEKGKQYAIHCRRPASGAGAEQVILDVNQLAQGEKFMSIGSFEVSDDARWLAYTSDNVGFRQYRLHVKDLASGRVRDPLSERVTTVRWAADNRTLFYTTEDPVTKRSSIAYRQVVGEAPQVLYEEKDERFSVRMDRTRSGAFLILDCRSRTTSEVRVLDASTPVGDWRLIAGREADHEYDLDHRGDIFFIRSNKPGRNFGLFTAPVADPAPARWTPLRPHRMEAMIESVLCFAEHYVVHLRQGGLVQFEVCSYSGGPARPIRFPEPAYSAGPDSNPEFRTDRFRYGYNSPVTPPSVFDHDMSAGTDELMKREAVLGGYDPANYVVERREAVARDGTRVPVSLLYRKGTPMDGSAPCYLEGYGAYGIPNDADFRSAVFSLVDRGVIAAVAHVRGGGELGKLWHDGGRTVNKMRSFTDFIDVSEFLVRERFTASDRLIITGGSAGGLLMGAVTNLRPDLFKAVVTYVPFVDVINTMLDESLPLTVEEFEEWGNPKVPSEYPWLRAYCPYTNLEPKAYPAILVKTSLNDSQVMYWEPAKYVARLRSLKTDARPLLLHINMHGGHGGASGRYDHLKERAFDYAFILDQLGIKS